MTLNILSSPGTVVTGVYYIAIGDRHVNEAVQSAMLIRRLSGDIPVALLTDQDVSDPVFTLILPYTKSKFSFQDKIQGLLACPFDRALYLDTDTLVCGAVSDLFDLLSRFDLAAAHASWRRSPAVADGKILNAPYIIPHVPSSFPELNTGVLLFSNCAAVRGLFRLWLSLFREQMREDTAKPWHDQPAFRQALWQSSIRFYVLTPEYNYRADFPGFVGDDVRILHGRHPQLAEIGALINRGKGARVFVPDTFQLFDSAALLMNYEGS